MRFTIEIDDNDRDYVAGTPWTANIYRIDPETGKSEDTFAVGFGATPREAALEALEDVLTNDDDEDAAAFVVEEDR